MENDIARLALPDGHSDAIRLVSHDGKIVMMKPWLLGDWSPEKDR